MPVCQICHTSRDLLDGVVCYECARNAMQPAIAAALRSSTTQIIDDDNEVWQLMNSCDGHHFIGPRSKRLTPILAWNKKFESYKEPQSTQ